MLSVPSEWREMKVLCLSSVVLAQVIFSHGLNIAKNQTCFPYGSNCAFNKQCCFEMICELKGEDKICSCGSGVPTGDLDDPCTSDSSLPLWEIWAIAIGSGTVLIIMSVFSHKKYQQSRRKIKQRNLPPSAPQTFENSQVPTYPMVHPAVTEIVTEVVIETAAGSSKYKYDPTSYDSVLSDGDGNKK